ncbi:MAG: segregation/condensation protein A, partial [Halobaculum sp.]
VLVQLAEDGEIDPWDIDIVAVTDAFLAELDETDLRTSGRALFYASVLLRMKSDAMLGEDEQNEEEESWETFREGGEPVGANDPDFDPVDALEAEMDRRLERKSARGTPETLDELVRELREAERGSWWKQSREYDTSGEPTGTQTVAYRGSQDMRHSADGEADEATATTHEEDIETLIEQVHGRLRTHYEQGRAEVLFREVRDTGRSPIRTYLAVLFLSHRGHVHLQQDDLFGDLWITDPGAAAAGDEAVAD